MVPASEIADLGGERTAVELAKDVAAMQVEGGFIVVGADDRSHPTGLVTQAHGSLFDGALAVGQATIIGEEVALCCWRNSPLGGPM